MIQKLSESRRWQLTLIGALILILPLMADINGRMGTIRRMRQEETRLKKEIAAANAEQETLRAKLEYVTDDAYLEQWARVEARMTLPGEVAVIPLLPDQPQPDEPTSEDGSFPPATSSSISEQWHSLFFDEKTSP